MISPAAALAIAGAALGAAEAPEDPAPPDQTLVFYNARIALREGRPRDVLKLWLLRNALEDRGVAPRNDADFRSVLWAALGTLGYCQDGLREDAEGAGLWPLALHNWALHVLARGPPPPVLPPFAAFTVGRHQRLVSLHDVLSAEELQSVEFFRTSCLRPFSTLLDLGRGPMVDLTDRLSAGQFLRALLVHALQTLSPGKVENTAVVEARIFDLDLAISELLARRTRSEAREKAREARGVGVSREGARQMREDASRFPEDSPQADLLRRSLTWTPEAWLTLSRERRLFLFSQALPLSEDPEALRRLVVALIDRLIDRREGEELTIWVAHLGAEGDPALRRLVTGGDRGARLLELEPETGFRERAVVALHRGVAYMEEGALQDALRSFAWALRHAEVSQAAAPTSALARRWLSYVLSRYQTTDEVIATLKALVPRRDYNAVVEDLAWRAALTADAASFQRVSRSIRRGSSFDLRLARLEPLSRGEIGGWANALRKELAAEPYAVLRFLKTLVERVEAEELRVRRANVPTLEVVLQLLGPLAVKEGERPTAHSRRAAELEARIDSVLEGLEQMEGDGPGKARDLRPEGDTFAGSIRLPPADPLPWPFRVPEAQAPSAFLPLKLIPVEWQGEGGARVFGWRVTE